MLTRAVPSSGACIAPVPLCNARDPDPARITFDVPARRQSRLADVTVSELPPILFAPVLRAEGWLSIGLQQQNILDALRARSDPPDVRVLAPDERITALPMGKQGLRDLGYPLWIRLKARSLGRCILHVTDH